MDYTCTPGSSEFYVFPERGRKVEMGLVDVIYTGFVENLSTKHTVLNYK